MSSCVPCIKRWCDSLIFPSRNHRISGVQKSHQRCLEALIFLEVIPDGTLKSLPRQSSEEQMTWGVRSSVQASQSQLNQGSACTSLAPEPRAFPKQPCSSDRSISFSSLHSHKSLGKILRVLEKWLSAYKPIHFEFGSSTRIKGSRLFLAPASGDAMPSFGVSWYLHIPPHIHMLMYTYTHKHTHTQACVHTHHNTQIQTEKTKDAQIESYFNIMHFLKCKNVAHLIRQGTFPSHSMSSVHQIS